MYKRQGCKGRYAGGTVDMTECVDVTEDVSDSETDILSEAVAIIEDAIAVSYTHLDVYKRQG